MLAMKGLSHAQDGRSPEHRALSAPPQNRGRRSPERNDRAAPRGRGGEAPEHPPRGKTQEGHGGQESLGQFETQVRQWLGLSSRTALVSASIHPPTTRRHGKTSEWTPSLLMTASSMSRSKGAVDASCHMEHLAVIPRRLT